MPLENPLPAFPPQVPQQPDSGPRPASKKTPTSQYSAFTNTFNAKGAVIPFVYNHTLIGGIFTYRSRLNRDLLVVYIWSAGGKQGISKINNVTLNDVITLDTTDVEHGQTKIFSARQGGITITNYFGTPDQIVDPILQIANDLPGFDENFVIKGKDGQPMGIAYSIVRIPANASLLDDTGNVVSLFGYPRSAKAELLGIKVYDFDETGFLPELSHSPQPIRNILDYVGSTTYGVGRKLDFASAYAVWQLGQTDIYYESATGQMSRKLVRCSFIFDQQTDLPSLYTMMEEAAFCWFNDDGETISFVPDEARVTDERFHLNDFITDPEVTTKDVGNTPNKVTVNYLNRDLDFSLRSIYVENTETLENQTKIVESTLERLCVITPWVAGFLAQKAINKARYEFIRIRYQVSITSAVPKRGHVHELTHPYIGNNVKFRVLNREWNGENLYTIEAEKYDERIYDYLVQDAPSVPTVSLNLTDAPRVENLKLEEFVQTSNNVNIARVRVTWDSVDWEGLVGFSIEYYQQGVRIAQLNTNILTDFIISDFTELTPLTVRVRSRGEYALGQWSEEQITPKGIYKVPDAPSNFNVVPITNTLLASWDRLTNQPGITEYELRYYASGSDYFADGVVIDRITGSEKVIQTAPPGTWIIGLAAVNQIEDYSAIVEDEVTVVYDDDLLLSNVFTFTEWAYAKPVRDYDLANQKDQLIGGSSGMILEKDSKRMVTSFGTVYQSNDCTTEKSLSSWADEFQGPMSGYTGSMLSNIKNVELSPDNNFGAPGSWTLGAGWSIANNILTGNATNTSATITVADKPYQNTIVKVRNKIVQDTFTQGYLGYTFSGRTQGNNKFIANNTTENFVYMSPNSDTLQTGSFNGNNSLTCQFQSFNVTFSECFVTTMPVDLGAVVSAAFFVSLDANYYTVDNGPIETVIEASEDDATYQVFQQNELIRRVRYVRVKVRGSKLQTRFTIELEAIKLTIRANQKLDSGIAQWGQVPDVQTTLSFIPTAVGTNQPHGRTSYLPQNNIDGVVVGTTSSRSFFIQFITGSDVTTRQCIYAVGTFSYSGFGIYIENNELIITGRFTTLAGASWPHAYSRQIAKPENFYSVGVAYDQSLGTMVTYINGKRANERTEFIEEYTVATNLYVDPFPVNLQSSSAPIVIGENNYNGNGFLPLYDGTLLTTPGLAFNGTVIRYIQFNGAYTDAEARTLYQRPWDSAAYPTNFRRIDAKFGDTSQTTGLTVDHAGTGRQFLAFPIPASVPGVSYISTSLLPVIAVMNKNFAKLFSAAGLPGVGPYYEAIVGNVEVGGDSTDTVAFHLAERNTFDPVFLDIDWRIVGI